MTTEFFVGHVNYWVVIILMMAGLYVVLARGNLVKKLIGLNVFQTSVFLLYISMGKIRGGTAPIEIGGHGGSHGEDHGAEHEIEHGVEHAETVAEVASEAAASIEHGVADHGAVDHGADAAHEAVESAVHGTAEVIYSNPLPHVLILTAIVVGVATLAVGLAIIVRIREAYGTIEEDEIIAADNAAEFGEAGRQ